MGELAEVLNAVHAAGAEPSALSRALVRLRRVDRRMEFGGDSDAALKLCDELLLGVDRALAVVFAEELASQLAELERVDEAAAATLDALLDGTLTILRGLRNGLLRHRNAILAHHPNPVARTLASADLRVLQLLDHAAKADAKYGADLQLEHDDFVRIHGRSPAEFLGLHDP